MKKLLILPLLAVFCFSCSKTPYYDYHTTKISQEDVNLNKNKIYIKSFDLKLTEKRLNSVTSAYEIDSKYLSTEEMKSVFLKNIHNILVSTDLIANDNEMDNSYQFEIFVDASRIFSPISNQAYVDLTINSLDIKIYKDKQLFATKQLIADSSTRINCAAGGFSRNIVKIFKSIFSLGDHIDEMIDVESCSRKLSSTILSLGEQM